MNKDRTTRFAIMLTLFGAAIFLFKNSFLVWFQTFYSSAYTKTALNLEHLLVVVTFTVTVTIGIAWIKYMYFELKTLQYLEDEEQNRIVKKADKYFSNIFQTIKYSLYILFIFLIIIVIYEIVYNENNWVILTRSFGIGMVLALLSYLIWKILRKINLSQNRLINSIGQYLPQIRRNNAPVGFLLYIGVLVSFLSFTITIASINGNKFTQIKLHDDKKILLELNTQNIANLNIDMIIRREGTSNNIVSINNSDFQLLESSVEVFKDNKLSPTHKIDIKNISEEWSKRNYGVSINQSRENKKYKLELEKYILEGKNKLELILEVKNENSSKNVYFSTDIYKKGKDIEILEKNFKIDL